jgi:GTP pyrophosphokinase
MAHFIPQPEEARGQIADAIELEKLKPKPVEESTNSVRVGGIGDVLVRFGRCCNPLPGERIRGVITRGKGVTVHTSECQRLLESDPQRHIEVSWENGSDYLRPIKIEVLCEDRPGLLAAMSKTISEAGLNISSADVRTLPDRRARDIFEVMVGTAKDLDQVMRNLSKVRGVMKVSRVNS